MSVDRAKPVPLWSQIAAELAVEIGRGVLRPGDRMPAEPELMRRFSVARSTVRQAVASLAQRGLVRVEQGRGTFVDPQMLVYPISERTRFSRNLIEQGVDPSGELLAEWTMPAGPEIGGWLGVPEWQTVACRRALGMADGVPVELAEVFVPLDRFPNFLTVRTRHPTYTGAFASYGVSDYVRRSTRVEARMPSDDEARLLAQPAGTPVLAVARVDADLTGRPILFGRSLWRADRVVFDIEGAQPMDRGRPFGLSGTNDGGAG